MIIPQETTEIKGYFSLLSLTDSGQGSEPCEVWVPQPDWAWFPL